MYLFIRVPCLKGERGGGLVCVFICHQALSHELCTIATVITNYKKKNNKINV